MTYDEFLNEWRSPDYDYIEVRTSGSTGAPKTIRLPKRVMIESARRTNSFFGITADSHLHSCISPDFIGGKMMAVRAEISGARFSYETPSNRPQIFRQLPNGNIDWPDLISVVPSQLEYVLGFADSIPESSRFLIGGSAIHPDLRNAIEESGINAWESYGMTETASHIALRRVSSHPEGFLPLAGINVSTDSRGCLRIDIKPDLSITTNDIAEIDEDGRFHILGRIDNVIISGGKKIFPEEVESKLFPYLKMAGISGIALTSIPDKKWGEATVLLAEYRGDLKDKVMLEKEIFKISKEHLEAWKVPKIISFVSEIPLTSNGKTDRHRLATLISSNSF